MLLDVSQKKELEEKLQCLTLTNGSKNRNLGSDNMDGRASKNMFCEKNTL